MANAFTVGAAGVGAAGNIIGGLISNAVGASTSKKLMKMQAALNYHYAKKSALNSPTWNRTGLENAGYNPMLAVQNATSGANSSWTSSPGVSQPDIGNLGTDAISNASQIQRLENETKQTDSTVNLQNEQAVTEEAKRENLSFQNAMLDVEKHLKDKDLSTYDERFYTEMYRMMQEAEKMRQEASVIGYNAESQRIAAKAQESIAQTTSDNYTLERDKFEASGDKWMQEWMEKHPNLYGIYRHLDNTAGLAGRVLGAIPNWSNSSQFNDYETHSVRYDKHGNIIGQQSVKHHSNSGSKRRGKR